jgi:hypothetical protein
VPGLIAAIEEYMSAHNDDPKPVVCTATTRLHPGQSPPRPGRPPASHQPMTRHTTGGPAEFDVPRGRAGTFEPQIVRKWQRCLSGVDEIVLSLYAKGSTTAVPSVR